MFRYNVMYMHVTRTANKILFMSVKVALEKQCILKLCLSKLNYEVTKVLLKCCAFD